MSILTDIQGKIEVQGIVIFRDNKPVIPIEAGEYKSIDFDQELVCFLRYNDETNFTAQKSGCGSMYDAVDKYVLVCLQLDEKYTQQSIQECMASQIDSISGKITKITTNIETIRSEEKISKNYFTGVKIYFDYERLYAPTNCPELVCTC